MAQIHCLHVWLVLDISIINHWGTKKYLALADMGSIISVNPIKVSNHIHTQPALYARVHFNITTYLQY